MHNARSVWLMADARDIDSPFLLGRRTVTATKLFNGCIRTGVSEKPKTPAKSKSAGSAAQGRVTGTKPGSARNAPPTESWWLRFVMWLLQPLVQMPKSTRHLTSKGATSHARTQYVWFKCTRHVCFLIALLVTIFISFGVQITAPTQQGQEQPAEQGHDSASTASLLKMFWQLTIPGSPENPTEPGLDSLFKSILGVLQTAHKVVSITAWIVMTLIVSFVEVCPVFVRFLATLYASFVKIQQGTPGPMRQYNGSFYRLPYSWQSKIYQHSDSLCYNWRENLQMPATNFTVGEMLHADASNMLNQVQSQVKSGIDPIKKCNRTKTRIGTTVCKWKPFDEPSGALRTKETYINDANCNGMAIDEFEKVLLDRCSGKHAVPQGRAAPDLTHDDSFCLEKNNGQVEIRSGCNCAWSTIQFHIMCKEQEGNNTKNMPKYFRPHCLASCDDTFHEAQPCQDVNHHYCDFRFCVEDIAELYNQERDASDWTLRYWHRLLEPSEDEHMPNASFPTRPTQADQIKVGWLVQIGEPAYTWLLLGVFGIWLSSQFNDLDGGLEYTSIPCLRCLSVIGVCLVSCTFMH